MMGSGSWFRLAWCMRRTSAVTATPEAATPRVLDAFEVPTIAPFLSHRAATRVPLEILPITRIFRSHSVCTTTCWPDSVWTHPAEPIAMHTVHDFISALRPPPNPERSAWVHALTKLLFRPYLSIAPANRRRRHHAATQDIFAIVARPQLLQVPPLESRGWRGLSHSVSLSRHA